MANGSYKCEDRGVLLFAQFDVGCGGTRARNTIYKGMVRVSEWSQHPPPTSKQCDAALSFVEKEIVSANRGGRQEAINKMLSYLPQELAFVSTG